MTRYKVTITIKSSCKNEQEADVNKLGSWNYLIDHGGLPIAGSGSISDANMTSYAATMHGIISAMETLRAPCFIVVRTKNQAIGQTAEGIKNLGWNPKGRKAWAQTDLWRKLVEVANKGEHRLAFEHY